MDITGRGRAIVGALTEQGLFIFSSGIDEFGIQPLLLANIPDAPILNAVQNASSIDLSWTY